MSATNDDDRIEKSLVLRAPRSRVWKALTDPAQFGQWFRATVNGRFEPGAQVRAVSTYSAVRSTPVTRHPYRLATKRAAPPSPLPTSSTWTSFAS